MPQHLPHLPMLTDEPACWVTLHPQVWRDDNAEETTWDFDEALASWDATPYLTTLSDARRRDFYEGAGQDHDDHVPLGPDEEYDLAAGGFEPVEVDDLDHGRFDYDDLLFADPHGPQAIRDWLAQGKAHGEERTYRVALRFEILPSQEVLAWREAVREAARRDRAQEREVQLQQRPATPAHRPRRRS